MKRAHKETTSIEYENIQMKLKNKSILITGGAGFIGSNLCADMLNHGNTVRCLDNLSSGNLQNLQEFSNHPNFEFIEGDIRDLETCQKACEKIDYVFHQAAVCSVPRSIVNPINTHTANIDGFLNILVAARDQKVKRLIYAASSSAYGDSKELPKVEGQEGKPLSPYALTKYVNELYAQVFTLNYRLETIGLRYFNVFGPNQSPEGAYAAVIPTFIDQLLNGQSPTVNGDGSFSRDFTFVENVVQMNHLAAITTNPQAIGEVFNTAAGKRTSLLELILMLKDLLSIHDKAISEIPVVFGPERQGDIPHSWANIEKAKNTLGYSPSTELLSQLKTTVEYYIQQD